MILEGRKRDTIRNQVLVRFSSARTLASALVSSRALVHLHERVSMCESVSVGDEHSIMERIRTEAALVTSLEN